MQKYLKFPILLILLIPSIVSFFFGFMYFNEPYKAVPIIVVNHDNSAAVKNLLSYIAANEVFDVVKYSAQDSDIKEYIDSGKAMAGLLIPSDFSDNLTNGKQAKILLFNDGALSPGAGSVRSKITETLSTIKAGYLIKLAEGKMGLSPQAAANAVMPISYTSEVLGNPDRKLSLFLIEGFVLTIVQISVAVAGASLFELKGFKEMLKTAFCCTFAGVVSSFLGVWIQSSFFGVPYRGSVFTGLILAFLVCLGFSFVGIILNLLTKGSVESAVSTCSMISMTLMFSGYTIPVSSMPPVFGHIQWFFPNTHFIIPIRDIALLGSTFDNEVNHILWLAGFSALMAAAATRLFLSAKKVTAEIPAELAAEK